MAVKFFARASVWKPLLKILATPELRGVVGRCNLRIQGHSCSIWLIGLLFHPETADINNVCESIQHIIHMYPTTAIHNLGQHVFAIDSRYDLNTVSMWFRRLWAPQNPRFAQNNIIKVKNYWSTKYQPRQPTRLPKVMHYGALLSERQPNAFQYYYSNASCGVWSTLITRIQPLTGTIPMWVR